MSTCCDTSQALVFLLMSACCDTAQALVFLLVSACCDTAQALVFLLMSACSDTAPALVFLLMSACRETAQAWVFLLMSACCETAQALVFLLMSACCETAQALLLLHFHGIRNCTVTNALQQGEMTARIAFSKHAYFTIPPQGQPHAVFGEFISISRVWMLLCKEPIMAEDSSRITMQLITF